MYSKQQDKANQYSSVRSESQPKNHITSTLWYSLSYKQKEAVENQLPAHTSGLAPKHSLNQKLLC